MADAFIESAIVSLSAAWQNDTTQVNCRPLTEALQTVSQAIASLQLDVQGVRDQVMSQRTAHTALCDEYGTIRQRFGELDHRVHLLTTDAHGFVQRSEMNDELMAVRTDVAAAQHAETEKVAGQVAALQASSQQAVVAIRALQQQDTEIREAHQATTAALEARIDEAAKETFAAHSDLCEALAVAKKTAADRDAQIEAQLAVSAQELMQAAEDRDAGLRAALQEARDEALHGLQSHGAEMDTLAARLREKESHIPHPDDVAAVRRELSSAREELADARFRLTETYSRCMALVQETGPDRSRRALDLGDADIGLGGDATTLRRDRGGASQLELDKLTRDVASLKETHVPGVAAVAHRAATACDTLNTAQGRVEALGRALSLAVGFRDEGDELFAACTAGDTARIVVLLRHALGTIAGGGGNIPQLIPKSPTHSAHINAAHPGLGPQQSLASWRLDASTPLSAADPFASSRAGAAGVAGAADTADALATTRRMLQEHKASVASSVAGAAAFSPPPLGLDLRDRVGASSGAPGGVCVMHVASSSVAAAAGLITGDVVETVGGQSCVDCAAFIAAWTGAARQASMDAASQGRPHCAASLTLGVRRSGRAALVEVLLTAPMR